MTIAQNDAPAMGERRSRMGLGAQDRLAAALILEKLRDSSFESIRLADLEGGQVDDFVLVWKHAVWGNSVKWTGTDNLLTWADLCGATEPLIRQLADGWLQLKAKWPGRKITVFLRTNRRPSASTDKRQIVPGLSLERFLADSWNRYFEDGSNTNSKNAAAWNLLKDKSGLDTENFREFVTQGCKILPGLSYPRQGEPGSFDAVQWKREFDRLRAAINNWVEEDPEQEDFKADDLRRVIHLLPYTARLLQRFPEPEIGYQENQSASLHLQQTIASYNSGYIAVVGPAGAGKSTLTQKILAAQPIGIPYFAYLPEGKGDPRERGDALAFYQYLITALEQWEPLVRASNGIADLAQAKEFLSLHMVRITERYRTSGHKTVILIDGLDHVTRESGLDKPLQLELPRPEDIGEGCLILLSTQPQALKQLREPILRQLKDKQRIVEVTPLSAEAVHACLTPEKIGRAFSYEEKTIIFESCHGNPLILTYLIKALKVSLDSTVEAVVERLGDFSGELDDYYEMHFRSLIDDPDAKNLLALLSRTRRSTQLRWFQTWPEWTKFEKIHNFHIASFFSMDGGLLSFVHNSLVVFLRRETLSSIAGADDEFSEQAYYKELARRCPEGSSKDILARDKIYYQIMSGDYSAVISKINIAWFREAAAAFVPPSELISLVQICYKAAVAKSDWGALITLVMTTKEVNQRESAIDSLKLARNFLDLDQPDRALEHIVDGTKLRVEPLEAMIFCGELAYYAERKGIARLTQTARKVFELAKPVNLMFPNEPIDTFRAHKYEELLSAWVVASVHFIPVEQTLSIIRSLEFTSNDHAGDDTTPYATTMRNQAHLCANLLTEAIEKELLDDIPTIRKTIQDTGDLIGQLDALFILTEYLQMRGESGSEQIEELKELVDLTRLYDTGKLRASRCLLRANQKDEARTLIENISLPKPEPYPEHSQQQLGTVRQRIELTALCFALDIDQTLVVNNKNKDYESANRVARACLEIGQLQGSIERGDTLPENLKDLFVKWFRFHTRRVQFDLGWRYEYAAELARNKIYAALIDLAEMIGPLGREALKNAFLEIVENTPIFFDDHHRRMFALALYENGSFSAFQATELLKRATRDAVGKNSDEGTSERTEICFEIAEAFHRIGELELVSRWVEQAGIVSHGIGYKDYQMSTWAAWLDKSLDDVPTSVYEPVVQTLAQALEVGGGRGGAEARILLIEACFRRNPIVGVRLSLELIERDQIDLGACLKALFHGATKKSVPSELLTAVYVHLYTLVEPHPSGSVGKNTVTNCGDQSSAQKSADRCVAAIKINVPTGRRRKLISDIADALTECGGIAHETYFNGITTEQENSSSSSSWRYKCQDNTDLSLSAVAAVLSDERHPDRWNPIPSENQYFAWDEALDLVKPTSNNHISLLSQHFIRGEKRDAEVLAALARVAIRFGDRTMAKQFADEAYLRSKDGGWISFADGAVKRNAFESLIALDAVRWLPEAQRAFSDDLIQGRISYGLIDEIISIFDLLKWSWPTATARIALHDYMSGMIAGSKLPSPYHCLLEDSSEDKDSVNETWNAEEAFCSFLLRLFAHPVPLVAAAARNASADIIASGNYSFKRVFSDIAQDDSIILERSLMALNTAANQSTFWLEGYKEFVLSLSNHLSFAVQTLAREICLRAKWSPSKTEPTPLPGIYQIIVNGNNRSVTRRLLDQRAEEIPGFSFGMILEIYEHLLRSIAQKANVRYESLHTRSVHHYREIEAEFAWSQNSGAKVGRWNSAVPVLDYLQPRALVGREAVMRSVNELLQAGKLDKEEFGYYESLLPAYDYLIDNSRPSERPREIHGISKEAGTRWKQWAEQVSTDQVDQVPRQVNGQLVIARHDIFCQADWDRPKQERVMGFVPLTISPSNFSKLEQIIPFVPDVTRTDYPLLEYGSDKLVIRNAPQELQTPASGWLALNPIVAHDLGWRLSDDGLFRWVDDRGDTMVESIWWRDGWIQIKPPLNFETAGQGWVVLSAPSAYEQIRQLFAKYNFIIGETRSCRLDEGSSERHEASKFGILALT